jgi:glycine/D-amino acid oxidase-like deaminating enzyme
LHTALALAERTFDPSTQIAHPPPSKRSWRRLLWPFQRAAKSPPTTNNDQDANIIILEASKIGIGASGRSMGWVGHGYQVPHENICANAIDAPIVNNYSIPALLRSFQSLLYNFGVTEMPPPQRYTISVADRLHDLSIEAMDRVRDIVIKYNIDCDWTEGGAVHGLLYDKQTDHEGEEGMLTVSQVNQIMGRKNDTNNNNNDDNGLYKSGGYDRTCGAVNPLRLTLGLADAVDKWGVQIYEQTKVIKLQRRSDNVEDDTKGKYSIITNDGHIIHCDHVVLCTGAGTMSSDISRRLSYSFLPFYTWMTATEPLGEECPIKDTSLVNVVGKSNNQRNVVRRRGEKEDRPAPPTYGDAHIILNYWRKNDYIASGTTSDNSEGRILFGSLGDTYPFPQWLASWRLRSAMSEIYPKFANVNFDYIWGGKLAMAINPMPLIGRDIDFDDAANNTQNGSIACDGGSKLTEGGVWFATAFAGHGIIPTAVAGSLIANAILGISDHQEWKLFQTYFPPSTWNGYPFSRLGAGAVLSLYNTFDWLEKRGVPTPPLPDLW